VKPLLFRLVYAGFAVGFALNALSHAFTPGASLELWHALGGGPAEHGEDETFWRILAFGNVATLAFCCALLLADLRRFWAALYPLLFMKGVTFLAFGIAYAVQPYRAFLLAFLVDAPTFGLLLWLALGTRGPAASR
jgi:hypothetical protein